MWLLVATFLFASATSSAQAQWQTQVITYSLSHPEYRKDIQGVVDESRKAGDNKKAVRFEKYLSQQDPVGYKEFVKKLKKGLENWVKEEKKRGQESVLYGKDLVICLSPYATNPTPGDVQVTIIWNNYPGNSNEFLRPYLPASIKIAGGVEHALEFIKGILTTPPKEAPHVLPTSTKRSA